ncbi:MAG: TetR/AcrR family transcriptional regulator [Myxococcaceae bacterium]
MPRRRVTARRKPSQERSQALVDTMLDALERLLAKNPLTALTTNRIAEMAGVSVGSLYQYFPDKHSLAAALIHRKAARDLEVLTTKLLQQAPVGLEAVLRATVVEVIELHRKDAALMRALLALVTQTGSTDVVRELAARGRERMQVLFDAFSEEIRETDRELLTFIGGRALEEVVHAALLEKPELLANPAFVEETFQLLWRFVKKS